MQYKISIHAINAPDHFSMMIEAENMERAAKIASIEIRKLDEDDTLLCTEVGCSRIQCEDGEFCKVHI